MEAKKCIRSSSAVVISPKDRISALPDDVLIATVSFLTMNEAAATSVLSKRWKNLWKFYSGSFDFDPFKVVTNRKQRRFPTFEAGAPMYVNWVNQVLNSHQGPTLQGLRICLELRRPAYGSVIDQWITFAVVKRVQWLELKLGPCHACCHKFRPELVELASSCLPFRSFDTLSVLCLSCLDVTEETLAYILSNCPSLENLSLKNVLAPVKVEIVGHALKLKYVELILCEFIEVVEISALNLVSFKYWGGEVNINFRNVPLLKEVSFAGDFLESFIDPVEHFSSLLSHLEILVVNVNIMIWQGRLEFFNSFPQLTKLRHLEVELQACESNLCCLTPLIYASPRLCSFTLKVFYAAKENLGWGRVPSCGWGKRPHESLKVVKYMGGWDGEENDLELINYLVENAVKLEKVIIDPHCLFEWTLEEYFRNEEFDYQDGKRIEVARARAKELLGTKIPAGAELVVL